MTETANQPDHLPSNKTSYNLIAQYLGNTVGGVGLRAFPNRFKQVWQCEAELCHAVESLFHASVHIVAVFCTVLVSIVSIEFNAIP